MLVHGVGFRGPLAPLADGFADELVRIGYTRGSVAQQLRLMAHLSRWLDEADLEPESLTPAVIGAFMRARRAEGRRLGANGGWLLRPSGSMRPRFGPS